MRTCFIHVGTHKTGTTSLQVALNRHHADLSRQHYLYPRTGRPPQAPDGHHNIAWEISADWRFRREHGTIDDLVAEIMAVPRNVILSSEGFGSSIHHPERFQQFIRRLQACHLAVTVVVYFRNQVDYAQSLYLTMLKFGVAKSFNEFVDDILNDGQFRWRNWTFLFCYKSLLTCLRAIEDVEVIVRSYDRPKDGSLMADCLSVFGLASDTFGIDTTIRANVRPNIVEALGRFYENRKGTRLDGVEQDIIGSMFGPLKDRRLGISTGSRLRIVERFRDSWNDMVPGDGSAGFGEADSPDGHPDRVEESLSMESVFSADLSDQIANIARVFRAEREVALNERDAIATRCDSLIRERDAIAARCDSLIRERDAIAATCDSLIRERDHLIERCSTLVAERDELARQCEALRNERQAMLMSSSWKLTAPLRRVRSALR